MIVMLPHKYEFSDPFAHADRELARLLCVCEQCRTEMAICWHFPFTDSLAKWLHSNAKARDEYVSDVLSKFHYELKGNRYLHPSQKTPEYKSYIEKEIRDLPLKSEEFTECIETQTCPVCHGRLEKGFFALSPYNFRWKDEIREHLAKSLTKQEIEQIFDAEVSETDLEDVQCLLHKEEKKDSVYYIQALCCFWIGRRYAIQKQLHEKAAKKVEMLAADAERADQGTVPHKESILGSVDGLKDYIRHLLTIEREIYSVGKRLTELYIQQSNTESGILHNKCMVGIELREQANGSKKEYNAALVDLENLKNNRPKVAYDTSHIPSPIMPERPILQEPGFFNKKKVLAHNAELTTKYQQAYEEYKRLLAKYESDCDTYRTQMREQAEEQHAQLLSAAEERVTAAKEKMEQSLADEEQIQVICDQPTPEVAVKTLLETEIAQAEKTYMELCKCRRQLYAPDVVFGKYRNIVALATFYEYLTAGRCTSLEGANGAYNIFEMECMGKEIIGQLRLVVDSLEEIKDSQYLVYTELQYVNSSLSTMNSTMHSMAHSLQKVEVNTRNTSAYMKKVAQNTEVIAYNTAATAYYAKANAELTNSLGYLIALH